MYDNGCSWKSQFAPALFWILGLRAINGPSLLERQAMEMVPHARNYKSHVSNSPFEICNLRPRSVAFALPRSALD